MPRQRATSMPIIMRMITTIIMITAMMMRQRSHTGRTPLFQRVVWCSSVFDWMAALMP